MNFKDILDKKAISNIKNDIISFIKISVALIFMLFLYEKAFGTVCYTQIFFNTPCPFCGITTSLIQFITLNFKESFETHPLSFLVIFNFLAFIFSRYTKYKSIFNILLVISFFLFIILYFIGIEYFNICDII